MILNICFLWCSNVSSLPYARHYPLIVRLRGCRAHITHKESSSFVVVGGCLSLCIHNECAGAHCIDMKLPFQKIERERLVNGECVRNLPSRQKRQNNQYKLCKQNHLWLTNERRKERHTAYGIAVHQAVLHKNWSSQLTIGTRTTRTCYAASPPKNRKTGTQMASLSEVQEYTSYETHWN